MTIKRTLKCIWTLITTFHRCDAPLKSGTILNPMDPNNWEIGPVIDGVNESVNMPLHPTPHAEGWMVEFKYPDQAAGSVHYVTMKTDTLQSKTKITLTGRFEISTGAELKPCNFPDNQPSVSLYFQRLDDNWTATGEYEAYRWYASFATMSPLVNGKFTIEAPLDQNWTAVLYSSRASNPSGFSAAVSEAWRVGFVLGGGDGLGHGVYATERARLIVTSFTVE